MKCFCVKFLNPQPEQRQKKIANMAARNMERVAQWGELSARKGQFNVMRLNVYQNHTEHLGTLRDTGRDRHKFNSALYSQTSQSPGLKSSRQPSLTGNTEPSLPAIKPRQQFNVCL